MQITKQADYAVRAVLYLAKLSDGRRAPTSQIARDQKIPPSFLAKIVSQLSVAGMVQTSRGARGGVTLAREPSEISLLEVIEAIDGPIALNECVTDASVCTFGSDCPVHGVWCESQARLVKDLSATTFGGLLTRGNGKTHH
ncbi:MAG TPA: Rrf2 family transcriptional regulator [Anaerolineales bacterium]|nr:Rrf2 family transcriptional regulator [Anaerolineales bacterium]